MREIKLRAWDTQAKCMLGGGGMQINATTGELNHLPSVILMQYTGLKDKNGKEIYEGDIVFAKWYGSVGYYNDGNMLIEFSEGTFRGFMVEYAKKEDRFSFSTPLYKTEGIEVIGNIYENPIE